MANTRKKGTPEYEEWLRKYREKRGKKAEEPKSSRQPSLFSEEEMANGVKKPEQVATLQKGTKKVVHSKSQGKDLSVEVIRFVPKAGKYLVHREDGKYLYYSESDMKDPSQKSEKKNVKEYVAANGDSVSVVPEGTMSAKIEKNVAPIAKAMTMQGMALDKNRLVEKRSEIEASLEQHKKELFEAVGHEFNFNAPADTARVLYDEFKLPMIDGRSTSKEVLDELAEMSPIPALIRTVRSEKKLITSYADKLIKLASKGDGKIHNIFDTTTASGRFVASMNPIYAEVPDDVKTEDKVYFKEDLDEIGMGGICPL